MYYNRARYYDVENGRFNAFDDWEGVHARPASLNKYSYTEGNPVSGIDPSGYFTMADAQVAISIGAHLAARFAVPVVTQIGRSALSRVLGAYITKIGQVYLAHQLAFEGAFLALDTYAFTSVYLNPNSSSAEVGVAAGLWLLGLFMVGGGYGSADDFASFNSSRGSTGDFNFAASDTKGIIGEISDDGLVSFAVEAGAGSPVRGTDMFLDMMKHFGSNVKGIKGAWYYGDNLAAINRLTAKGRSLADAALDTWTGRRAAEQGFTSVRVIKSDGSAGAYKSVEVVFE